MHTSALNRSRASRTSVFAWRGRETSSCSVTVTFYANAEGLKSCSPSPLLRMLTSPLKHSEKARAISLFQKTCYGLPGRKPSASNLRNLIGHVIGLEAKCRVPELTSCHSRGCQQTGSPRGLTCSSSMYGCKEGGKGVNDVDII